MRRQRSTASRPAGWCARRAPGRCWKDSAAASPGDIDALCDALVNLGRLARDLGDVIEAVDVNPLLVREQGVVALDGLVVLRPPGNSGEH